MCYESVIWHKLLQMLGHTWRADRAWFYGHGSLCFDFLHSMVEYNCVVLIRNETFLHIVTLNNILMHIRIKSAAESSICNHKRQSLPGQFTPRVEEAISYVWLLIVLEAVHVGSRSSAWITLYQKLLMVHSQMMEPAVICLRPDV